MQDTITTIYCVCDDLLKAMNHHDDRQTRFSSAEVMTVPLVACTFFGGNQALSRRFLHGHGYTRATLSASRFARRLAALPSSVWHTLFSLLGEVFKKHNQSSAYVIDSMPVPVCDNIRIRRCKLFQDSAYRGYIASKRRYFYGLRVHLLVSGTGCPIEFVLAPGADSDIGTFKGFNLDLPPGSIIHADKGYTDYAEEKLLKKAGDLTLLAQRRKNSKQPYPLWKEFLSFPIRKRIETSFSDLTKLLPKHIHAVTPQGFMLKVVCFLLAFSVQCLSR